MGVENGDWSKEMGETVEEVLLLLLLEGSSTERLIVDFVSGGGGELEIIGVCGECVEMGG